MSDLDSSEPRRDGSEARQCFRKQGVVGEADGGDAGRRFLDLSQPHDKFSSWLAVTVVTDDPVGDLIDDLRRDTRKPVDIASAAALRRYLVSRRACREAIRVVPKVWRRFEAGR